MQHTNFQKGELTVTLEHLNVDAITPELLELSASSGGPKNLVDNSNLFLAAKSPEGSLLAFVAYHYGFEEDVVLLCLDWVVVSETARRQGLGRFLLGMLDEASQKTSMKGLRLSIPVDWTSTHPSKIFLQSLGFELCACQPTGRSTSQYMAKINDEEAQEFLVQRGEKQRKEHAAAQKKTLRRDFEPSAYSAECG